MPCLKNGICSTDGIEFLCTCPSYTTGKTCEIEQNPCVSEPCKNGGDCYGESSFDANSIISFFECSCLPGFHGKCKLF